MGDLGRYFDVSEFTRSSAAAREELDNTPTEEALQSLRLLVQSQIGRAAREP